MKRGFFLTVVAMSVAANAQYSFGGLEVIHIGQYPNGFTVADFNNDAIPDVAISAENSDKVEVYANDGAANFTLIGAPIFLGSSLGPQDVVHLDYDRDGDKDLAVAISRFDIVRLLTNDGLGNFTLGGVINTGLFPTKLVATDFDGDEDTDLVVLNRDAGSISIQLNTTSGFVETQYPIGLDSRDVEVGDFDGDGDDDVVTTSLLNASLTVWYNDGLGAFSGRVDLPTIFPFIPYDVDVKDIDDDGDDDLVTAGWGDGGSNDRVYGCTVYKSNGMTWQAPVFYSLRLWAGLEHEAVTLGDFDSDGDFDILGGGNANGTLDFLTNTGNGTYVEGYEMYGGNPITEMQNVDLNGDLKPDLLMTHHFSGGGTGPHLDYFINTSPQNWIQLPPATLTVETGSQAGGNLASVAASDNEYASFRPGVTFTSGQAPIQVVMESTSPTQSPTRMKLALEGHTQFAGIARTFQAYDFVKGNWVTVVSSTYARGDDLLWFDIDQAARFVEAGTRKVRVKVSFRATRPVFTYPWNVRIDRVAWAVR